MAQSEAPRSMESQPLRHTPITSSEICRSQPLARGSSRKCSIRICNIKPERATRVRGRIEVVLNYAAVRGFRAGPTPGSVETQSGAHHPGASQGAEVGAHAALPYGQMGEFMAELRQHYGIAARALEFAILTAARTGEVLGARWSEINLAERGWIIPAERMKAASVGIECHFRMSHTRITRTSR